VNLSLPLATRNAGLKDLVAWRLRFFKRGEFASLEKIDSCFVENADDAEQRS